MISCRTEAAVKAVEAVDEKEKPEEEIEEEAVAPKPGEVCEISDLIVVCEHGDKRKKKIMLPAADKTPPILEVVGAGKGNGDKIKTSITLSKPRCSAHTGNALEVKTPTG